jgi:anti-sigma regulatory factor (Ser/Thr protein kinase)
MDIKTRILRFVRQKKVIRTADVVRFARISRQAAARHLRELVATCRLSRKGITHGASYSPFNPKHAVSAQRTGLTLSYQLRGLEEDRVWEHLTRRAHLTKKLSAPAFKIVQYAFTEILNNAIDHSRANRVRIELKLDRGDLRFKVVDRGVGVFQSVRKKFKLKDDYEAAEHLLKGKQTTAPARHSGQGIFFTSRIADHFVLSNSTVRLDVNNVLGDIGLIDIKAVKGTEVTFTLKQRSRKNLKAIFDEFTDSDLEFDKTVIRIKLSRTAPGGYVSRSEARRLLFGLEKFKRVVIDFNEVRGIGQGFADEIFRVFGRNHPGIRLEPVAMTPSVAFFVKRALQENQDESREKKR